MTEPAETEYSSNAYEFSVSELAQSLKRTIEETFGHVRVRGELGRVTIAKSGHCYLDIKDDKAVINSIIWKGTMNRLSMRPEEGMEVIVEGRLSTYPGRSNYQLIVEKMELAGAGALMALFEKRKKMFAAEGLFDAARKRELPFMPSVIGVVTSPTGAVIRDIIHRIEDRFPSHVILWPVLVQGDKAAEQIAAAITGFNHAGGFPRPDILIVGRGGGSLEDLWCFNEEIVVRAAATSDIPIISAVGHETDWTLMDYVVDYRAPTPTGAAEVAVPVRSEWLTTLEDYSLRLTRGLTRSVNEKKTKLIASRLPRLESLLSVPRQRLDVATAKLGTPNRLLERLQQRLAAARIRPADIQRQISLNKDRVDNLTQRASHAFKTSLARSSDRLSRASGLLEAYSYQGVLQRGYALVTDDTGKVIRSKDMPASGDAVTLTFADGDRGAVIDSFAATKPISKKKPKIFEKKSNQGDLF
ncbi:MAG: exodeoxyribonuclease VII large subunit [Hellea sp.]|nr:exodeoxyribonuclease VII large subunit [Hellea sp.]